MHGAATRSFNLRKVSICTYIRPAPLMPAACQNVLIMLPYLCGSNSHAWYLLRLHQKSSTE